MSLHPIFVEVFRAHGIPPESQAQKLVREHGAVAGWAYLDRITTQWALGAPYDYPCEHGHPQCAASNHGPCAQEVERLCVLEEARLDTKPI